MIAIDLRSVTKRFGDLTAVESAVATIPEAAAFLLTGPSGSGKTTLLNLIAGLEQPNTGEIWLEETQVSGNGRLVPPHLRRCSLVFEDLALWPHMTVQRHLEFVTPHTVPRSQRERRCGELLESLEVGDLESSRPDQLSLGQRRRVAIGRALASQPRILLLDEPLGGLDGELRERVTTWLLDYCQRSRITVVLATHIVPKSSAHRWDTELRMEQGQLTEPAASKGRDS